MEFLLNKPQTNPPNTTTNPTPITTSVITEDETNAKTTHSKSHGKWCRLKTWFGRKEPKQQKQSMDSQTIGSNNNFEQTITGISDGRPQDKCHRLCSRFKTFFRLKKKRTADRVDHNCEPLPKPTDKSIECFESIVDDLTPEDKNAMKTFEPKIKEKSLTFEALIEPIEEIVHQMLDKLIDQIESEDYRHGLNSSPTDRPKRIDPSILKNRSNSEAKDQSKQLERSTTRVSQIQTFNRDRGMFTTEDNTNLNQRTGLHLLQDRSYWMNHNNLDTIIYGNTDDLMYDTNEDLESMSTNTNSNSEQIERIDFSILKSMSFPGLNNDLKNNFNTKPKLLLSEPFRVRTQRISPKPIHLGFGVFYTCT